VSNAFFHTQLPWNFITKFHPGVVVQKDGILQRTFAYRAPDLDSSGEFRINGLCLRVNDFAKRLGSGWAFFVEAQRFITQEYPAAPASQGNLFDTLAGYLIDREREASFSALGKHYESSYFITFAWKPPSEGVKKLTSMFVNSGSGGSAQTIKENVASFVNETDAVAALLSQDMLVTPLTNEQTAAYLHSSISLNRHPIRFPCTQIMLDRILPDSDLVTSLTMRLGGFYIPVIGVNDFPEETYPAILESLNRARMEYRWVSRYVCLDKEDAKKEAQKKEKSHRGSRKTFLQTFAESTGGGSAAINHGAGVKEADSIDAGIEIETDEAALGYYTSCVMVWDADYKKAKKKAETARNIINGAGFTCKEETFNALEAFKSMMPGQVYANYRALPVMSYNLSHVVPLSSVWSGMRVNEFAGKITGVNLPHITCSTQEGTPFFLNINPGDVGHTAVWGPTGAGKSTLLNLLETQFFKYPESQVIVFDKGKSCRQICLAQGGLFYEPAAESAAGISFQPLRELETDRDLTDAMDFIESLCMVAGYAVAPPLRAAIKESLELLREKPKEARTITSFLHYCNYMDEETKKPVLKEMLGDYLWAGGKYGKIFDSRHSALSLDTRFLAVEMEDLMNRGPGCIVPALVYLFNLVEKKFDGRLSLLVLDEAWLFLKNETFSEKIAEWLKVLRKKNVFVVFATQDVADVEKSPLKTTVIQQCLTKIYLADPSALTAGMTDVYRAFGLADSEIGLIAASVMKRDYFYTSPLGRRLFQLDLGPLTLALIGAPDHKLLDTLLSSRGPGVPLCRQILDHARVDYRRYLGYDAPREENETAKPPPGPAAIPVSLPPLPPEPLRASAGARVPAAEILDAVSAIGNRRSKGEGRAADSLAAGIGVSPATVYQALKLLKYGGDELIARVRSGEITIKKAAQSIARKKAFEEEPPEKQAG
jgi:type IV secretion system protein VirB4